LFEEACFRAEKPLFFAMALSQQQTNGGRNRYGVTRMLISAPPGIPV